MRHGDGVPAAAPDAGRFERGCALALELAGWCYVAMTLLICFDVVARRMLGVSTEATTELSGYLLAMGLTWGLAGTLHERAHVRVDVLVQKAPLAIRAWLHLAAVGALLLSSAMLAFGAVRLAIDSWQIGATDISSLRLPLVLPQGLWAAGLALFVVAVAGLAARTLVALLRGDAAGAERRLAPRTYQEEADETLDALRVPPSVETDTGRMTATH